MREEQSIASELETVAPALPKHKDSKPFQIPWERNEDNALMMSVNYLKGYFNGQDSLKDLKVSLNLEHSVFNNHFEFYVHVSNTENYTVSIGLTFSLMEIHCSCNSIKKSLCQHAYTLIRDRLRDNRFYFKHLYNEQWNYPRQQQRKLFKVYVANVFSRSPKVILNAVDGLGRVYRYPNDNGNIDSRFYFEEQTPSEKEKRLVFAIPINNDIYGLPILIPFLSRDRRGNTFQSSYLFNKDLPQPNTLTSYELAL